MDELTRKEYAEVLRAMGALPCGPTCHWRMCARSNTFGSHASQRTLVRHEIRLRMSA